MATKTRTTSAPAFAHRYSKVNAQIGKQAVDLLNGLKPSTDMLAGVGLYLGYWPQVIMDPPEDMTFTGDEAEQLGYEYEIAYGVCCDWVDSARALLNQNGIHDPAEPAPMPEPAQEAQPEPVAEPAPAVIQAQPQAVEPTPAITNQETDSMTATRNTTATEIIENSSVPAPLNAFERAMLQVEQAFANLAGVTSAAKKMADEKRELVDRAKTYEQQVRSFDEKAAALDAMEKTIRSYGLWPDTEPAQMVIAAREALKALHIAWTMSPEFTVVKHEEAKIAIAAQETRKQVVANRKQEAQKLLELLDSSFKAGKNNLSLVDLISMRANSPLARINDTLACRTAALKLREKGDTAPITEDEVESIVKEHIKQLAEKSKANGRSPREIDSKALAREVYLSLDDKFNGKRAKHDAVVEVAKDVLAEHGINIGLIPNDTIGEIADAVFARRQAHYEQASGISAAKEQKQEQRILNKAVGIGGKYGIDDIERAAGKGGGAAGEREAVDAYTRGKGKGKGRK